jgi:ubiquitin-activating enzyme E1
MNTNMNVTAYQEKVAADTEHLFGDDFYDTLSGVCTALDNVEARLYVDQRCLCLVALPMLEKWDPRNEGRHTGRRPTFNGELRKRHVTLQKEYSQFVLSRTFQTRFSSTLQWARDYFEGEFKQAAEESQIPTRHSNSSKSNPRLPSAQFQN